MISEGSWRLEYDAENSALITVINYILKHLRYKNIYFNIPLIFQNITIFTVFSIKKAKYITFWGL